MYIFTVAEEDQVCFWIFVFSISVFIFPARDLVNFANIEGRLFYMYPYAV